MLRDGLLIFGVVISPPTIFLARYLTSGLHTLSLLPKFFFLYNLPEIWVHLYECLTHLSQSGAQNLGGIG
jgi:hypothetical protein